MDEYKFKTIAEQFDELDVTPQIKTTLEKFIFDAEIQSQSLVDWLEITSDENEIKVNAAVVLYNQLSDTFVQVAEKLSGESSVFYSLDHRTYEFTCKTLEAFLKCSASARKMATEEKFLLSLVQQMMHIFDCVGGSFTDFARQHGNLKVIHKLQYSI